MADDPLARILAALGTAPAGRLDQQLCDACCQVLGVDGVAVTVVPGAGQPALLSASDATASALDDLQSTLGEGPRVDAHRLGVPVGQADLADPDRSRWMTFAEPARALGAAAVFAYPLRVGGVRVGVLSLYQRRPGPLSDDQRACALALADSLTQTILAVQAGAPAGALAGALAAAGEYRAEVHQAAGMLAVRFETSVGDALVRLRAHAYGEGRAIADIARDVVAGKRSLD